MNNVYFRLLNVNEKLRREEERLKDLNTICGNYKDFTKIISLGTDKLNGRFNYYGNSTLSLFGNVTQIQANVVNVEGNGYEGNKYVINDNGEFISVSLDTGNRDYMVDSSILTAYEYSRLTMSADELKYPPESNFDNEEAVCSVTVIPQNTVSSVNISSDIDSMIIKDLLISQDGGVNFKSAMTKKSIAVNNLDDKYSNFDYIYGSGIIGFETANCLKIIFRSNGTVDEKIRYKVKQADKSEIIYKLDSARRHLIRINNIALYQGSYESPCLIYTDNLIDLPVKSIAVFANEFAPSFFSRNKQYFKYVLTVNGEDHEIVPLNAERSGTKIIRFNDTISSDAYVKHIRESIKSARLTVTMITPVKTHTPYLSNLKIYLGDYIVR